MIFATLNTALTVEAQPLHYLALIIFLLPVITFALLFFTGKNIPATMRSWTATFVVGLMFVLSVFLHTRVGEPLYARWIWFSVGDFVMTSGMLLNSFTTSMMIVVTFIGLMVHLYSIEYMRYRRNHSKYFPYLALFISAMIGIVLSDSLFHIFLFWELVGLASYLLIGFWYQKKSAAAAAKKAFMYNKVADTGFVIAIGLLLTYFGTTDITTLQSLWSQIRFDAYSWSIPVVIGGLLWLATIGKSAQFPFYVWLPDAMEGPTPVSALLHAATMVAAGILVLIKCDFMMVGIVADIIVGLGAITSLLAALQALHIYDSKKILAFSTVSQLGYMMMAIGSGNTAAAYFHLGTHAFFKAGLFLTVGAVIHSMHHIQQHQFKKKIYLEVDTLDIRLMGGFRKTMPITFYSYAACYAALIGLPLFSGFLSKDAIIAGMYSYAQQDIWHAIPLFIAIGTVALTAYYMTRQLYWMFLGEFRLGMAQPTTKEEFHHIKENHLLITIPLVLLGMMATVFFVSFNPFHGQEIMWMKHPLAIIENHMPWWLLVIVMSGTAVGITLAITFARKEKLYSWETNWLDRITRQNYGVEQAVDFLLVRPTMKLGNWALALDTWIDYVIDMKTYAVVLIARVLGFMDRFVIDGTVNLLSNIFRMIGNWIRSFLQGQVQSYIGTTLLLLALLLWYFIYRI